MKTITAVLIGAGLRGMDVYAAYALQNPGEIKFVAVAEPNETRRSMFCKAHNIPEENSFTSWQERLGRPRMADTAFICTQDRMHYKPTLEALEKGYHILLEKPMSNNMSECMEMERCAARNKRFISVCHVLRYSPFYAALKDIIAGGKIGDIMSIQQTENVAYWHQAHSFVRGNWRNAGESSPMILQKSCHDMDIISWLIDQKCTKVSSFGSLSHFKSSNAPEGSPKRCLDGCPVSGSCIYYAPGQYLTGDTGWPTSAISNDLSLEGRTKALKEGPYGRCVYHCDNDVVDHQVVNLEFERGATASFTMCAFTADGGRTIKAMGTKGQIRGHMEKNEIEVHIFGEKQAEAYPVLNYEITGDSAAYGHGGGDYGLMKDFVRLVSSGSEADGLTSARASLQSHLMAFAAEISRLENRTVWLDRLITQRGD